MKKTLLLAMILIIVQVATAFGKGSPDISKFCDDAKQDGIHKKYYPAAMDRLYAAANCQDGNDHF